jgi:hypothetical protein
MNPDSDYNTLREDHEALRFQFISTELDLAITFCQMALTTNDRGKAERNAANAHRAYQAASHRLETPTIFGPQSSPEIDRKIRQLEQLLMDVDRIPR